MTSKHCLIAALGTAALVAYGSVVPLRYTAVPWNEALTRFRHLPWHDLEVSSPTDWGTNVLVFVPVGFFLAGSLLLGRHGLIRMVVFSVAALLACLVLSLAIEFAQLWFPSRVASPKDVAAEALGGLLGTLAWLLIGSPIVNARNERLRHVVSPVSRYAPGEVGRPNPLDTPEGANRVRWVWVLAAAIYSAGLCGYYWDPYDWTTDEEFVAYRSDRFWRLPFSSLQAEGYLKAMREMTRKVVSFLPLGVFCTLASRQLSSRWTRIAWGLVFGFGVGTTVELGQLFLPSRFPEVTDALLCGAGAGVGMLLSSLRFRMRSRRHAPVQ